MPLLEARSLPIVTAVQAKATLVLPAPEGGVLPPLLDVPAVAAPTSSTTHWKVAGTANCWLSPPHRWCSGLADGHLVDCCWEGIPLAGVVVTNQCLCQLETEGLHTLPAPTSSWPALPHQNEGVRDAAIHEEPEDVPVVSKLHSHLCMTEIMYLCIH